jgi:hypothetical protein
VPRGANGASRLLAGPLHAGHVWVLAPGRVQKRGGVTVPVPRYSQLTCTWQRSSILAIQTSISHAERNSLLHFFSVWAAALILPAYGGGSTWYLQAPLVAWLGMATRCQFENSNDVGVFGKLTNAYCLVAQGGSENFYR